MLQALQISFRFSGIGLFCIIAWFVWTIICLFARRIIGIWIEINKSRKWNDKSNSTILKTEKLLCKLLLLQNKIYPIFCYKYLIYTITVWFSGYLHVLV